MRSYRALATGPSYGSAGALSVGGLVWAVLFRHRRRTLWTVLGAGVEVSVVAPPGPTRVEVTVDTMATRLPLLRLVRLTISDIGLPVPPLNPIGADRCI